MKKKKNNKVKYKKKKKNFSLRSIMGQSLPFSDKLMGDNSFPGPVTTYSPSLPSKPMVNLGCLSSGVISDIVPIKARWPSNTTPYDYTMGNNTYLSSLNINNSINTNFQSTIYLTSDVTLYGNAGGSASSRYSDITLSQEGLLWTLWPLAKKKKNINSSINTTYFDSFNFGTALSSEYSIGQLGFFTNNLIIGCTPLGGINPHSGNNKVDIDITTESGIGKKSAGIQPGIETLNQALIFNAGQQVGIVVVKISEQISRIFNPISGVSSNDRFIYVGYDAWSVILTSSNPLGPMMAQTYITPQSVTGQVITDADGVAIKVVFPPNFVNTVFYRNDIYNPPTNTINGLFTGSQFT